METFGSSSSLLLLPMVCWVCNLWGSRLSGLHRHVSVMRVCMTQGKFLFPDWPAPLTKAPGNADPRGPQDGSQVQCLSKTCDQRLTEMIWPPAHCSSALLSAFLSFFLQVVSPWITCMLQYSDRSLFLCIFHGEPLVSLTPWVEPSCLVGHASGSTFLLTESREALWSCLLQYRFLFEKKRESRLRLVAQSTALVLVTWPSCKSGWNGALSQHPLPCQHHVPHPWHGTSLIVYFCF